MRGGAVLWPAGQRYRSAVTQPEVVVLCGSVRFAREHLAIHRSLSLTGCIVLLPALPVGDGTDFEATECLDSLHLRNIDLADRVHLVNLDGYVGPSTQAEIAYAESRHKPVTYEWAEAHR